MSEHADLLARHRKVMPTWLGLYYDQPIALASGRGCRVTDAEGVEYLDFFAGILTNMLGYDVPEVRAAIEEQIASGIVHTSTLYLIAKQVTLAERIAELSGIPDAKVFFTASGSEAIELALMLCSTYRRSNSVLALRNSYHGRSYAAMAVTGNRGWSASSYTPLNVSYAQSGYRYRSAFGHLDDEAYIAACSADLREVIDTTTSGDVACLIAEPIQGVGGFTVPPDGLFGAYQEILSDYGILYVSDEVQTGWGRTGENFWGYQAHGVVPDALTFAKGLGNGLTIGGVVARGDLMDCLGANSISTFGGNPLSTAAGVATLDYLLTHDLQANAHKVGNRLLDGLRDVAQEAPGIGEVRGKGLMMGVELVQPGTKVPDTAAAGRAMEATRAAGLLVGKGGLYGNVLRVAPPLVLTEAEADEGLDILRGALT